MHTHTRTFVYANIYQVRQTDRKKDSQTDRQTGPQTERESLRTRESLRAQEFTFVHKHTNMYTRPYLVLKHLHVRHVFG